MLIKKYFVIVVFCLIGAFISNAQKGETLTIIKAGNLIDPESKEILKDQIVIIEGIMIKSVIPEQEYEIPDGVKVIDLSEHFVFPGLIESHTHICMALPPGKFGGNIRNYFEDFLKYTTTNSTAYRAIVGAKTANELLLAGFTTIRDLGNAGNFADTEVRRGIEEGLILGPTIINSGKIIAPLGGQYISQVKPDLIRWFDNDLGDYVGVLSPERIPLKNSDYIFADTLDELLKAIRTNILFGAKVIKIVVDDQKYFYSQEDIEFIVEESNRAGLKVAAHCITNQGAINAILGGAHSIEHGSGMTMKALQLAKENNVFLVPAGGPLKEAYQIGVKIAFGADNIRASTDKLSRIDAILRYLTLYKNKEIPDAEILQMMTTNPAELLGISNKRGKIKKFFYADIVATKENPLENIAVLKEIEFVMKDGQLVKFSTNKNKN